MDGFFFKTICPLKKTPLSLYVAKLLFLQDLKQGNAHGLLIITNFYITSFESSNKSVAALLSHVFLAQSNPIYVVLI